MQRLVKDAVYGFILMVSSPCFLFKKKTFFSFCIPLSALSLLSVNLHAIPLSIPPLCVTPIPTSRPTFTQKQPLAHQGTERLGTYSYTEARKGGPFRSMISRIRQATDSGEAPILAVGVLNEDQAAHLLHICMHLV